MPIDLLNDKNYTSANLATKQAIFEKHVASLDDYKNANSATQNAIRNKYGIGDASFPTIGKTPIAPKEDEGGFFDTIASGLKIIPDVIGGIYNWFNPEKASSKQVNDIIKSEQTQDRNTVLPDSDINKTLKRDKGLFESFKREAALNFEKQGTPYDETVLNQEAMKKLSGLGYNQGAFSTEDPTLVFKQNAPKLNVEEIEAARMKAAQSYTEKIDKLEEEMPYAARFFSGEGHGWDLIGGALSPFETAEDIKKRKDELRKLREEKNNIDQEYKSALSFQTNKYTASKDGVMNGFLSSQLDPTAAILDPDKATSIIQNSYNQLFSQDDISLAKSSKEGKEAFKKSLVEKSVFLNNDFRENALIELKAMEEGKVNTDAISEKLGLEWWQELVAPEQIRGYSSLDQQYHLSQQIKREKEPIVQSINQDKLYKEMYDKAMKDYVQKKKVGQSISIDGKTLDEAWFKSTMNAVSALDASIKKKESDLNYLETLELNDTKEFKQFQENQRILNETGDKTRTTFAILENGKSILSMGRGMNDLLYILSLDDEETVDFRGKKLKREEIEAARINKPLREIDQVYELLPEIGDSTERVKATEAEALRIFDESGKFNPDVDWAVLAGTSVHVAGFSRVLGGAAVLEEMTAGALLKGALGKTADLSLKELGKTGVRNVASELAKRSVMKTSNVALGYVLPTNLLLGSESVKRYMEKGYNFDQSFSLSMIDNTIEALTEAINPNDAMIVKNMIIKGEIKTAKELAENEIYKNAFKKTYKAWTGNNLSDKLYNTFKAYSPSAKEAFGVLAEETGEEIVGEGLRSVAYRTGLSRENPILDEPGNFTFTNIANIAVSTMATMIWTGAQSFKNDVKQRTNAQSEYQYLVGKNIAPYTTATLDLLSKNEITEDEAKRRLGAITKFEDTYNISNALASATNNFSELNENEKETLKQQFFLNLSKKNDIEKAILEAPTEEEKMRLLELLDKSNLELNDLKLGLYKTDEERVESRTNAVNYFINPKSVSSFSNVKQIDYLAEKYETYKSKETNEDLIKTYDEAITLLKNRKAELEKQEEEDLKTPDQKATEAEDKGTIKIKNKRGQESEYQIGKKYIANRQVAFGEKNPVRFPEVTFVGYKKNEAGEIEKDDKGSPIVILDTVTTKGNKIRIERPVSVFENFLLGEEQTINSTAAGRFYNKFKSKKFLLSLKDKSGKLNWIYNLLTRKKVDVTNLDSVEGYLSIENVKGKPVIYFNFINPNTKKENYLELSDKMISFAEKGSGFLRPAPRTYKTKAGETIIKEGQYEDLTPEEMEEMGFFTEKELEQYYKYLQQEDFSDLKNERLLQERERRQFLEKYIEKISSKLRKNVEDITKLTSNLEEYKELIRVLENIKPFLSIARFNKVSIDDVKKILPKTKLAQYEQIKSSYQKILFLKEEVENRISKYSQKMAPISERLAKLEEVNKVIKPLVDAELASIEEINPEELDFTTSLVPQIEEKLNSFKEAIKQNEEIIKGSRENISALEKVVESLKAALSDLLSTLKQYIDPDGFVETQTELNSKISKTLAEINQFNSTIQDLQEKNEKLQEKQEAYEKILKQIKKLEKRIDNQTKALEKEQIKRFLYEQQKETSNHPTSESGKDEDDNLAKTEERESAKKYFETFFETSTSFGENYEQELKDPKNNYANARLDFFFNNFTGSFKNLYLIPINKKNAEKFGLTGILYGPMIDTDVKLVVARKLGKDDYAFLDMNGNELELNKDGKYSPDQVIYTSLQSATLTNKKGELKYNINDPAFSGLKAQFPKEEDYKAEVEKIAEQQRKIYEEYRQGIVNNENPAPFNLSSISRGIPQYTKKNAEGQYERNPVRGTLISEDDSLEGSIEIADVSTADNPKLGLIQDANGRQVRMPIGRPVLVKRKDAEGQKKVFQFLDNHKFSKKQKQSIGLTMVEMIKEILENYEKARTQPDAKIVQKRYTNFLSGILYWRNPLHDKKNGVQNPESVSGRQLWLDFTDGVAKLHIGNKSVSLVDLLKGDVILEGVIEGLYHNVNKSLLGKSFEEFYVERGKLKSRVWDKYENYLLSEKYPDGTLRPVEEIPLTTSLTPNASPFDENGKFNENYNPQYRSRYFTFRAPNYTKVKTQPSEQKKTATPAVSPTAAPAPAAKGPSTKSPETIKKVNDIINEAYLKSTKDPKTNEILFDFFKGIAANLKEGVIYKFNLTSERAIIKNDGNPLLFSFTVKYDQKGNIVIDSLNYNPAQDFLGFIYSINPEFKITKEDLEQFFNFVAYNSTEIEDISLLTFSKLDITEEPILNNAKSVQSEISEADAAYLEMEAARGKASEFFDAAAEFGIPEEEVERKEIASEVAPETKQEELTEKKEEEAPKTARKGRGKADKPEGSKRVAIGEAKIKENLEKAKEFFYKILPDSLSFEVTKGLVDGIAWGKFVQNGVILSEAAEIGTIYHEAFEVVAGLFLNRRQWNDLVREFRSRKGSFVDRETGKLVQYSKATDHQAKEELAEEYRDYQLSNGKSRKDGQYKANSLFRTIYNYIKHLIFGDPKNIEDLFRKISAAEYKNAVPVKWNRPFNLQKSYRIANLEDNLFFYQLNKSLSLYFFRSVQKESNTFEKLFTLSTEEFKEIYKNIKNKLNRDYFYAKDNEGNYFPITDFYEGFENVDEVLTKYDKFFELLLNDYRNGDSIPVVFQSILDYYYKEEDPAKSVAFAKNKIKDAILASQYINSNWKQAVEKNVEYLNKFKIEFEGSITESEITPDEEGTDDVSIGDAEEQTPTQSDPEVKEGGREDAYAPDMLGVFLKNTVNKKVKMLIATLPVSYSKYDPLKGEYVGYDKPNDLGLPESAEFSKTFRKVASTVIEETNILEQIEAIKEAIPQNPEFYALYTRLGQEATEQELIEDKDLFDIRKAFESSFNKQRIEYSRIIGRIETKKLGDFRVQTLLTNLVNSTEASGHRAIQKRYLANFKNIVSRKEEQGEIWRDEENNYIIPKDFVEQSTSKDLDLFTEESVAEINRLGFDTPYSLDSLTQDQKKELSEIAQKIISFIKDPKQVAKLENLKTFNFSKHVAELAKFEFSITKDGTESQHRNMEGMAQSNDISQNSVSIVYKILNKAKNLKSFEDALPRFKDIFTQNALWRKMYFNKEGRKSRKEGIKLSIEAVEGIALQGKKGKHTSNLSYGDRVLQEFIYNTIGDSKNFKNPCFYFITPADIKTELAVKWGKVLVELPEIEKGTAQVFDSVLKGYLTDEIMLARELSQDDRGLKEYRKTIKTPAGERTVAKSLRMFNDILTFDYTDVIDNPQLSIEDWITENKAKILKDIDAYFDSEVDNTFNLFAEELIIEFNPALNMYDFIGMETQMMEQFDSMFDTTMKSTYKRTGKVLISEADLKRIMRYRAINYFANINEQSKLFFGDLGQFGDPSKRVKSFVSTRETTIADTPITNGEVYTNVARELMNKVKYVDEQGNVQEFTLTEEIPGYQSYSSNFKASTIDDIKVVQRSLPYLKEVQRDSIANDIFFANYETLPDDVKKLIDESVEELTSKFEEVEEADGEAWMTLPLYRQFLDRSGRWNDDLQELYDYHMAYERNKRNQYSKYLNGEKLREIDNLILQKGNPNQKRILEGKDIISYPVLKPIGAGVRPGDKFITTLDKCSICPLHYQLLEGKPALDMYISAIDNDVQYFRMASAHKVGTPAEMQKAYNKEGVPNNIVETDTLSFLDFAIQVETGGIKDKVTRGTQLLKLAVMNLMESSVPIDFIKSVNESFQEKIDELKQKISEKFDYAEYLKEWKELRDQIMNEAVSRWNALTEEQKVNSSPIYKLVKDHNNTLTSLTDMYFEELSEEFSITRNEKGDYVISNYEKFKEAIHRQLKDRDASNNLLSQLEIENGKFIQPFDFVIGADKLEPVIMAILNKNVVRPSVKGKALAQIASTFFDNSPRKFVKKVKNPDGTFTYKEVEKVEADEKDVYITSSELIFYGDYYVEEDGVTRHATEQEIKDGKAKIANFAEVLVPPIFKDTQGNYITDIKKIDPELLKAIGYRIPTQEMSSIENIRIKGFLPLEYQNGIVVPSSITAKAGSDFDIDKLTMYLYHYIFSAKNNKLEKISYLDNTNSTPEQRYIEYVKEFLFKNEELLEDDELAESYKVEVFKEMMKNFTNIVRKKFENIPVFEEKNEQFKSLIKAIKEYPNKKDRQTLLDTAYDKASNFEKYEAIVEVTGLLKQRELNPKTIEKLDRIEIEIGNLLFLDEGAKSILDQLKKSSKKTKGYSLMKGVMKQKERELLANYVYMYNISLPNLPSYSEFLNFPIDKQNTKKALENRYIDTLIGLVSLNENRSRLTTPNSADKLKALAGTVEKLKANKARLYQRSHENKKYAKYASYLYNSYVRFTYIIGKAGVGIGALGMTNHAVNQWLDTVINDPAINEISVFLPTNTVNGNVSMTFKRDANGEFISDNITQFINAFVDIARDPFIIKINGTADTAGTYLFMNKIGIPLDSAVMIMNQPIVEMYQKLSNKVFTVVGSARLRTNNDNFGNFVIRKINAKFGSLKDDYQNKTFTVDYLKEMIENQDNLNDDQKQDQLKILSLYLRLHTFSESLRSAISTYNYDVDILKMLTDVFSKNERNAKYLEYDPQITIDSQNTFFNSLEKYVNGYTGSVSSLFASFSKEYRKYISPILRNVSQIMDQNSREVALADVKKGFANYILLTIPFFEQNLNNDLVTGSNTIQNSLNSLLVNYETSVSKRLKELQERMKSGELSTNFALQELFRLSKDSQIKTLNLTVFNKSKDPEYTDLMVNSLRELEQSPDPKISRLAKDIYTLALLQSGLNQSNVSISQYIPADSFLRLIKVLFSNLKSIDPALMESHFLKFKSRYYANKWKDSKFTTTHYGRTATNQNLSKNPLVFKNAVKYDENGKLAVNSSMLAQFQLVKNIVERDQEDRDFRTYKPMLFQRVEFENGDPVMIKSEKGYDFIYKQVTPLGQGQYSLEYSGVSQFNENVNEDSNEKIIQNLVDSGIEYSSLSEIEKTTKSKPVPPATPALPTTPVVTPSLAPATITTETIYSDINKDNLTQSENVVLPKDLEENTEYTGKNFWNDIVPEAKSMFDYKFPGEKPMLIAYRGNKKKTFLQNYKDGNTVGNPFDFADETGTRKEQGIKSTKKFIEWMITGNNFGNTNATEEYRQAIINDIKSGKIIKSPILYYEEKNYATHATALDYLINKYDWSKPTTPTVSTEVEKTEIIPLTESERFTRESAEKDKDYLYLFTDNSGRTSGSGTIDPNSWYAKKYGASKKYASKTQAVARGLENAYPITTMVDDKRTQWDDKDFDKYKEIIDDEIDTIKKALPNYKGIKFGAEMPFGKGAISNMKESAPKIWNYLNQKLAEIGIDNTGDKPIIITQPTKNVNSPEGLPSINRTNKNCE